MSRLFRLASSSVALAAAALLAGCEPPPPEWLTELSCGEDELAFVTRESDVGLIEAVECQAIPQSCPADGDDAWGDELSADCLTDLCGTDAPSSLSQGIYPQPETDDEYVVVGCEP